MIRGTATPELADLYEADEIAWLEQMAALASRGEAAALDLKNLDEYLTDISQRAKREILQRLKVLLVHLLKWEHQREKRSRSWELTVREQREELQELLESGTLRNHAESELSQVYRKAVRRAAVETELAESAFPPECRYSLDQIIGPE